jgi:hypothetical protein
MRIKEYYDKKAKLHVFEVTEQDTTWEGVGSSKEAAMRSCLKLVFKSVKPKKSVAFLEDV